MKAKWTNRFSGILALTIKRTMVHLQRKYTLSAQRTLEHTTKVGLQDAFCSDWQIV
jgi:hypothetical protein